MKKTLFPEMDTEIARDRLAERREQTQRAREFLRGKEKIQEFILSRLRKGGPAYDVQIADEVRDLGPTVRFKDWADTVFSLSAMWKLGRLWRVEVPDHPCGELVCLYGIRGEHQRPKSFKCFPETQPRP